MVPEQAQEFGLASGRNGVGGVLAENEKVTTLRQGARDRSQVFWPRMMNRGLLHA